MTSLAMLQDRALSHCVARSPIVPAPDVLRHCGAHPQAFSKKMRPRRAPSTGRQRGEENEALTVSAPVAGGRITDMVINVKDMLRLRPNSTRSARSINRFFGRLFARAGGGLLLGNGSGFILLLFHMSEKTITLWSRGRNTILRPWNRRKFD